MKLDNIIRILIPMPFFDYDALISQFYLENSMFLYFWVSESHNFMYIGHLIDLRLYLKKTLKKICNPFKQKVIAENVRSLTSRFSWVFRLNTSLII